MLTGIHHLTFVVRDLDASVERWCMLFGPVQAFEQLPARNVRTARFAVGATSVVLVQPIGSEGAPAQHLATHGEGLLLMSLGVPDLDEARAALAACGVASAGSERTGVQAWRVQDLDRAMFDGVQIQLCETAADASAAQTTPGCAGRDPPH